MSSADNTCKIKNKNYYNMRMDFSLNIPVVHVYMYLNYWFKHFTVTVQKVQEFVTVRSKINVCILEISPTPNQILGDPLRHLSYFNFTTIFFFFASTCVISPKKFIFYYFYICMSSFVTHKFLF